MPGGRPRGSSNVRERFADAHFSVTVYERTSRPGFRVVARRVGGDQTERIGTTLDEALTIADGIWRSYQRGELGDVEPAPATLSELVQRLGPSGSAARVWSLFQRHVGERGVRRVWRLDVVGFLDATEDGRYRHQGRATAEEQPTSSATCLSYLRTLRAGFRFAQRKGWIDDDPTEEVTVEHEHELGAWMPRAEWEPYLTACAPAHAIRSGIALETGMREGEIAAARPHWLRGEVGRPGIFIGPDGTWSPKWGSSRFVPLTAEAQVWVARARAMWPGSRYLFAGDDGLSALGNFARETRKAVLESGVTRVTFHGLRRSCGAHLLDLGLSLLEVSRILGHRTLLTTERWYAGVGDSTLVQAIAYVDARRAELELPVGDVTPLRRAR